MGAGIQEEETEVMFAVDPGTEVSSPVAGIAEPARREVEVMTVVGGGLGRVGRTVDS